MKPSSFRCAAILWLAFFCALAGCGKPQPAADSNGAGGQGQNKQRQGGDGDEAARILAETIKRSRKPAEILAETTPTPTLGEQAGVAGRPFTSFGGGFVVTPPPRFSALSESVETATLSDGRPIEKHLFNSESPSGSSISIGYADVVAEGEAMSPPQHILEGTRDGGLEGGKAKLERQEFLTIQGYPAISFYGTPGQDSGGPYIREIAILKGRRLYVITYGTTDRAELDRPEVEAFFKSFTMLDY